VPSQTFDEIGIRPAREGNVAGVIMTARTSSRHFALSLSLAVAGGCLVACSPDKGPGALSVEYVLGNNKTCEELGVVQIEVTAFQGTVDEPTNEHSDLLNCDNDNEAFIDDIEPGIYSVSAVGYDADDVAIYDNHGQPLEDRRVEIFEASETPFEAELTARPAELRIAWRLGVGGNSNCSAVGIDRLEITAFEQDGGTVLLETEMDCEMAGDAEGFRLVPDPDRDLNGARFGEVGIQPIDSAGNSVGDSATIIFMPPGPGYGIELYIECTDAGCYEQ
jgi:hypothetical protein